MAFPLRLAISLRDMAHVFAHRDGISLNHFISLAVAEKVSRMEHESLLAPRAGVKQQKMNVAAGAKHGSLPY